MERKIQKNQYNARTTVLQMLEDRGYNVDPELFEFTYEDFLNIGFTNIHVFDEYGNEMYVYFSKYDKPVTLTVLTDIYSSVIEETENEDIRIIVLLNEISNTVSNSLIKKKLKNLEIFKYDELKINITKHQIMPKFEILTEEEETKLFERNKFTKKELPSILVSDPICKYYNADVGTIFKILRKSPSIGISVEYKKVI